MAIFLIYGIIIFVVVDLIRRVYLPSIGYTKKGKDSVEKFNEENRDWLWTPDTSEAKKRDDQNK